MKKKKKASWGDVFYITFFGLLCGIMFVIGYMFYSKVNTNIQANNDIATEGKTIMQNTQTRFVSWFDGLFLVAIVGL